MQEANNSVQSKSRPHSKRKTEREGVVEPCDISIEFKNDRRITHHKREKKLEERPKTVATVDDQDEARKSDQSDDDIEAGGKRLRLGDNEKSQVRILNYSLIFRFKRSKFQFHELSITSKSILQIDSKYTYKYPSTEKKGKVLQALV